MEILQTIWTSLTTENETLTILICSPIIFIELYVSMCLFTTVLNISVNKKQKLLYVISLGIIGLFTAFFIPTPYNTFVNIIACPILVFFLFKTNILKCILAEIIPYIIFTLLGSLLLNFYIKISHVSSNMVIINTPIHKLIYSLLLYLFSFLLSILCEKFNLNITLFDKMKRNNNFMLSLNFIVGIIAISLQSYLITMYINNIPLFFSISNIAILFIYFCISFYSLIRTNKLEVTTESLEEEKLYNKTLTILYDNIRGFKHDFNNIVQAIGGYVSTNNLEGLKDYYSDLMADCQKVNNLAILNPELINNPAIYSLLTSKYHKADELGIKINLETLLDLSNLNIKSYELTRILGILLDNAIEASAKCNEKIVNVIFRKDKRVNRNLIIIENTYENKDVDTEKIFEKGYTSKTNEDKKNHGLGLWEVRKILNKNNNLNLFTTKDSELFKQQLEIYY